MDFAVVREHIQADLQQDYDYALHLGQAPGSGSIRLESIALNIGGSTAQRPEEYQPLVDDGPVAFRSALPLADWVGSLRQAGIPAQVSYHAGTYLCNATLYLTHYFAQQMGLKTQATFIHLPLDVSQAAGEAGDVACLPAGMGAATVRQILHELRA